VVRSISNT